MSNSIAVAPGASFGEVNRTLSAMGWVLDERELAAPPLVPGEPELASWHHSALSSRITQTFNPVVGLRVLEFSGDKAPNCRNAAARALPVIGPEDLEGLLGGDDTRAVLLGIFAAVELDAFGLLPILEELRGDGDAMVAGAAADAHQRLTQHMVAQGVEHLQAQQRQQPDRSALFSLVGSVRERRQMLRWLAQDYDQANADILKVLRSALADDDWEIRVTAMLVAARLGADELILNIRRMDLPHTRREGLDREDRGLLLALRKAVLAELAQEPVAEQELAPAAGPAGKAAMWVHLRRCVAGRAVHVDQAALWVHALITPLTLSEEAPPETPVGVVCEGGQWRLAVSGLELCRVAGGEHWLGEMAGDLPRANPPRRLQQLPGFFIARQPVTAEQWRQWTGEGVRRRGGACTAQQAVELCAQLGRLEGLTVQLPGADQWEMACRGPDGRRHPWGMGFEAHWRDAMSPWDLKDYCSGPEWVIDNGTPCLCGRDRRLRCAARSAAQEGDLAAVRPVLPG